jgi:hypothetical protein
MRNFVGISDIHFNLQNLEVARDVLLEAISRAASMGVPLYIGGDLNDTKSNVRAETISTLISIFRRHPDVEVIINIGNHDLVNHHSEKHSLEFLRLLNNVYIVDEPRIMGKWGIIPYIHSREAFLKALASMSTCQIRKILIHQGVQGALMNEFVFDESSVSIDVFKDFDLVLSGHYHMHQWIGEKFMYFGSPYTTRSDEAGQRKYFHEVHMGIDEKVKIVSIETNVRKHVKVEFEDRLRDMDKLPSDSIVKVVLKGERAFVTSVTKEKLKEILGVENLTIVPHITKKMSYRMDVNAATKPQEVVMDFLKKSETQLDKGKLESFIARLL